VAALARWRGPSDARPLSRTRIALSAHAIESSLAGVPCGMQDQLAAAYGGSHAWYWRPAGSATPFAKRTVLKGKHLKGLESNLLVAYCGLTHESSRINRMWVEQFVAGLRRDVWCEIVRCTRKFVDALSGGDLEGAVGCMNREMALRRDLTPEVLDPTGERLVTTALQNRCGARIAGAGGGGCLWALGQAEDIHRLRTAWQAVLASQPDARLLATRIDTRGLQ